MAASAGASHGAAGVEAGAATSLLASSNGRTAARAIHDAVSAEAGALTSSSVSSNNQTASRPIVLGEFGKTGGLEGRGGGEIGRFKNSVTWDPPNVEVNVKVKLLGD